MKLGFVSAILDSYSFEEMIDTASNMGYECVEVLAGQREKQREGMLE
jgi:sugar phosphate isomerase/epimerase